MVLNFCYFFVNSCWIKVMAYLTFWYHFIYIYGLHSTSKCELCKLYRRCNFLISFYIFGFNPLGVKVRYIFNLYGRCIGTAITQAGHQGPSIQQTWKDNVFTWHNIFLYFRVINPMVKIIKKIINIWGIDEIKIALQRGRKHVSIKPFNDSIYV